VLRVGEASEDRIGSNCGQAVRVVRPLPAERPLRGAATAANP
jgi:hypothetical protein